MGHTMYTKSIVSSVILSSIFFSNAIAQDADPKVLSNEGVIEKVEEIANSNQLREILSVEGVLTTDDSVFFLETLKFEDGGVLELTAGNKERIFLLAKEVRLNGPHLKAEIRYVDRSPLDGKAASDFTSAPAQITPRSNGTGVKGTDGSPGQKGEDGITRQLPTLYVVADDLQIRKLPTHPFAFPDVRINVDGIDGGRGGEGGNGQNGGKGQNGRHGIKGFVDCKKSAKFGGGGGTGGAFGPGGVGGDGGNGGDIIFVVSAKFAEHVKDMRILSRGGLPGQGGINGLPGVGGETGDRGSKPGSCGVSGSASTKGARGQVAASLSAKDGELDGNRGRIRFVEYADVAELFTLGN